MENNKSMETINVVSVSEAVKRTVDHMRRAMRTDLLRNMMRNNPAKFKEEMEKRYSAFKANYPTLFSMVIEDRCDDRFLVPMLNMLKKMEKNEITDAKSNELIGQLLYDEYVLPLVDKEKEPVYNPKATPNPEHRSNR